MNDRFDMIEIDGKKIVINGIGKLFYEMGLPIHISVDMLKEKGYGVSVLHIADELYKNGWKERAIINTLSQDFERCGDKVKVFLDAAKSGEQRDDTPPIGQEWLYSKFGYEAQREILFQELFGFTSNEAIENKELRDKLRYCL